MKFTKRAMAASGLVAAAATGAMVLAGPTAEAATARPSYNSTQCSLWMNYSIQQLSNYGLLTPPYDPKAVINYLLFDANVFDAQGRPQDATNLRADAWNVGYFCF
ncbi:hypothetical protein [Streptantibioticus ferralitis]|uniref:hypothetical protein n=1 Tax=Streptantibioticus ferralitis TaxID=236510 RepID=UPI0031DB85C2